MVVPSIIESWQQKKLKKTILKSRPKKLTKSRDRQIQSKSKCRNV